MPFKLEQGKRSDVIRDAPSYVAVGSEAAAAPLHPYTVLGLADFLGLLQPNGTPKPSFEAAFGAVELISEGYLSESRIKGLEIYKLAEVVSVVKEQRRKALVEAKRLAEEAEARRKEAERKAIELKKQQEEAETRHKAAAEAERLAAIKRAEEKARRDAVGWSLALRDERMKLAPPVVSFRRIRMRQPFPVRRGGYPQSEPLESQTLRRKRFIQRAPEFGGRAPFAFESDFGCSLKINWSTSWMTAFIFRKVSFRFPGSQQSFRLRTSASNSSFNRRSRICRVAVISTFDTTSRSEATYGDFCGVTKTLTTETGSPRTVAARQHTRYRVGRQRKYLRVLRYVHQLGTTLLWAQTPLTGSLGNPCHKEMNAVITWEVAAFTFFARRAASREKQDRGINHVANRNRSS
jgi:hypothetical protein